jgi:hypothetical protein
MLYLIYTFVYSIALAVAIMLSIRLIRYSATAITSYARSLQ